MCMCMCLCVLLLLLLLLCDEHPGQRRVGLWSVESGWHRKVAVACAGWTAPTGNAIAIAVAEG
jgi:hypothetical protein